MAESILKLPTAAVGWSFSSRVYIDDSSYAYATINPTIIGPRLTASAFDFSAISDDATIVGIQMDYDTYSNATSASMYEIEVYLMQGATTKGTNQSPNSAIALAASGVRLRTYGGPTNLMGWTDVTVADVKNSNFGVSVKMQNINAKVQSSAFVDYFKITVYYEEASGAVFALAMSAF